MTIEKDLPAILELQRFLKNTEANLRTKRMYGELLNIEVAQEILTDVAAVESEAAKVAYDMEQSVIEAETLIKTVSVGLTLTSEQKQLIDRIHRHLGKCVEQAHSISESLKHADKISIKPEGSGINPDPDKKG